MARISSVLFGLRNRHFLILDVLIFVLTPTAALLLRTDGVINEADLPSLLLITCLFTIIKLSVFYAAGAYSRFWRYASVEELGRMTVAGIIVLVLQSSLLFFVLHPLGLVAEGFPRSIPLLDILLAVSLSGAIRYSVRFADRLSTGGGSNGHTDRVVVAGANWAGVTIVKEMQRNPHLGMLPVAFVDDDPVKQKVTVAGVPVLGQCNDIAAVLSDVQARKVIIAMPSASGKTIRKIVELCEQAG